MYNTSSEFNEAIKSSSREFKSKVLIGEDEYSDDKVINFSVEQSMAPSDEFSLGAFSSAKFELSIFLDDIRTNKIIKPFVGIKVGQGFEYVPLGVFNIENKSIKNGVVTVTCYDNAGKFEKPYFSDLTYPATLQSVANEICTKVGAKLASTLPSLSIDSKIDGYTCREALSFIASACGGFAIANRNGDIEIKTVGASTSSITGDNYFTFETDDKFTIKKVTAHIDKENVISRGDGIGVEEVEFSNPIVNDSIMNYVYSKLKDYSYVPAKLVWQGNPSIDIGEKMTVTDISAIKHDILVMRNKIVYEGGLRSEISSLAKSLGQSNFNYNGNMQGAIDRVTAEQIVVKELLADKADIGQLNAINANIENLTATKADIEDLKATNAVIDNLKVNKADITDLNATNATITNLQATKADIVDLNATNATIGILEAEVGKIGVLEGDVANIQDIIGGNISSDNIQSGGITGDRLNMNTVFVKDANIVNVNANKLNAGEIDTNKVKIKSADGAVEIVGATQQFRDKNNKVRIQMGKDTKGDFNFIIRGEDGTTTLIDHTGVKEKAIADNLIKENMIAADAVGEKALDYNSFASGFNKDTNTSTLKATKVRLDNQNQTLDVAFTSLKNQADATKTTTESNTTQINVQQGQISTAIANTKIVKDGKEVLLKDDYNTTVATVNSMKNTISSHTTKIDANTGKIGSVESKTNVLERDLNSMSSKLSSTETTVKTHTTQISTANTNASNAQNTANTAVSKADKAQNDATSANNKVDNIQIGGRNYIILSKLSSYTPYNSVMNENGIIKLKMVSNSYITLSIGGFTPKNKKYTMSGIAKLNGKLIPKDFFKNNKANTYNGGSSIIVVENDGRFRITETWVGNSTWLLHCLTTAVNNDIVTFEKLKFEEGEKNTDFTESPEDIQQQIDKNKNDIITVNTEVTTTKNKVSGIEQNLDSITTRVGSVESTTTTHTTTINSHTSSLNAVDGKINTAKTDAINTSKSDATTKANDAKNQAINSAATDAQNKANKALNDAKSYTGAEITKVNSTMTSKFAEIKTTTDSITQTVSNTNKEVSTVKINVTNAQNTANTANSKIDGLELGGRNLLPKNSLGLSNSATGTFDSNTNTWTLTATPSSSSWGRGLYIKTPHNIIIPYGKCAIYSFEIKVSKQITWNTDVNNAPVSGSAWSSNDNDDTTVRKTSSKTITKVNEWVKCWSYISNTSSKNTAKIDIKDSSSTFGIVTTNETSNVNFQIRNFKVELGNKATDWTPAPEDVSKEILDVTTEKVNQAKAEIKVTTDSITNRVSSTEQKTTTLTTSVNKAQTDATKGINDAKTASDKATGAQNTANSANSSANLAKEIAQAMSNGKLLYTDPMFKKGTNNCGTYNNSGGSTVEVLRVTKPSDCPTKSTHCLEIRTKGSPTSPGWGGFIAPINSRANAKFIIRLIAKIPTGRTLTLASNSLGTNSSDKLLTSNAGTGAYTEYIREVKCGSTGSFSSGGHFYLAGGSTPTSSTPLIWNVALCEVYDVTDCDYTLQDTVLEVTTVKNKTATLETNVNSITGRVSSVESTTSSLNGKVIAHESRLASAEQKITSSAIINTVQSTINTAKNEAINTANSNTNNQLKGYTTKNEFTKLEQTSKDFQLAVKQSSNYNLFKRHLIPGRLTGDGFHMVLVEGVDNTCNAYGIRSLNNTSFRFHGIFSKAGVYSVSFLARSRNSNEAYLSIDLCDNTAKEEYLIDRHWRLFKFENISIPYVDNIVDFMDISFHNGAKTWEIDFCKIMINEGPLAQEWVQGGGELISGITTINENGVRCDFEDGTFASMGRNGLRYYKNGMDKPYQYITHTTKTDRLRNGYWTWVNLPELFRGKAIDTDFRVAVAVEDIDCNAYVSSGMYNGALRNFKAEVGVWESGNCRLQVRCCIQKIGLSSNKIYGWDDSSTDAGAVAGESAARVMIHAQM